MARRGHNPNDASSAQTIDQPVDQHADRHRRRGFSPASHQHTLLNNHGIDARRFEHQHVGAEPEIQRGGLLLDETRQVSRITRRRAGADDDLRQCTVAPVDHDLQHSDADTRRVELLAQSHDEQRDLVGQDLGRDEWLLEQRLDAQGRRVLKRTARLASRAERLIQPHQHPLARPPRPEPPLQSDARQSHQAADRLQAKPTQRPNPILVKPQAGHR